MTLTSPQTPRKLLIIRPDAYGDIVLFQPVLQLLRETWSQTEIVVLIQERYADLTPLLPTGIRWLTTKCDPYRTGPTTNPPALDALQREITKFAPDCVVAACFDKTWLEAMVAAWAPTARQISLGPYELAMVSRILLGKLVPIEWPDIYREIVSVDENSLDWDKNLRLARYLTGGEIAPLRPRLNVPEKAHQQATKLLQTAALKSGAFVACCPAGISKVSIKAWPAERYGKALAWLEKKRGQRALLIGHENERDILAAVQSAAQTHGAQPAIWRGQDGQIAVLAALLQQSQFYFGNDTGALHIAAALDRPVVSIFGGGHWPRFRPVAQRSVCVVQPLPCFGCGWDCSFGDGPCVKTIPMVPVQKAIDHLLAATGEMQQDVIVEDGLTVAQRELIASVYARLTELQQRLETSEADRAARLENIQRLEQLLGESERDRAARLGVIQTQGAEVASVHARLAKLQELLETSEADRGARLKNIQQLEQLLGESERDRAARLGVIQTQGAQLASLQAHLNESQERLKTSEADRAARLGVIQTQGAQVADLQARLTESQQRLETDQALRSKEIAEQRSLTAKLVEAGARLEKEIVSLGEQLKIIVHERDELRAALAGLQQELELSEAHRVAHSEEINKQRQMLEEADSKHKRLQVEINYSKAHAGEMQTTLQQLGDSHTYRVMRALGLWRSIAASAGADPTGSNPSGEGVQKILRRVVVDLTPVLPGADNGGAKLLALELVRQLAQLAPSCEWILLTSEKGHADLASLDSQNVRRVCLGPNAIRPPGRNWVLSRRGRRSDSSSHRGLLRQLDADVIFCPFTTARFFDSRTPLVAIVYDLQYLAYPEFFSATERGHRDRELRDVCRFASRLVCISNHVRAAVLEYAPSLDPSRVTSIHISLFHRLANSQVVNDAEVLARLGLSADHFLLYPANYWRHKNHEMLLTAFGMYRARHLKSDLKLVCTGGLNARREELQAAGARMGMNGELVLTEYLPNEEFAVLLRACRAVIFPSLFEGFGMPVLEAMAADKPVLCSNLTSLPEVVGDAAVLFDPRKPVEIVQAIEQVESNPEFVAQLIQRGRNRLAAFNDTTEMARRYLHVLQEALDGGDHFAPTLHGVFVDGWTGDHMTVMYDSNGTQRYLEMTLYAPPWLPSETLSIRAGTRTHVIKRDQMITLRHRLPAAGGALEIQVHPTFQPQAKGIGTDTRTLGCLCRSCRILSPDETVELFAEAPQA